MTTHRWRFAHPMPWTSDDQHTDGLIRIHTLAEPIVDVCFVPINGNALAAYATAAFIVAASELRGAL